jgi:hypothetical protein
VRDLRVAWQTGRRRRVDLDGLTAHARALVQVCWRLGACPEHAGLRRWAHQLGFLSLLFNP